MQQTAIWDARLSADDWTQPRNDLIRTETCSATEPSDAVARLIDHGTAHRVGDGDRGWRSFVGRWRRGRECCSLRLSTHCPHVSAPRSSFATTSSARKPRLRRKLDAPRSAAVVRIGVVATVEADNRLLSELHATSNPCLSSERIGRKPHRVAQLRNLPIGVGPP